MESEMSADHPGEEVAPLPDDFSAALFSDGIIMPEIEPGFEEAGDIMLGAEDEAAFETNTAPGDGRTEGSQSAGGDGITPVGESDPEGENESPAYRYVRLIADTEITVDGAIVRLSAGSILLCIENSDPLRTVFCLDGGIREGCIDSVYLEALAYEDAMAAMGNEVILYMNDIEWPLPAVIGSFEDQSPLNIEDGIVISCDQDYAGPVVIPDGVTGIGDYAFLECKRITEIQIPDSVVSIGVGAFQFCIRLNHIVLPKDIAIIPEHAFYSCDSLSDIEIPYGITAIGSGAFLGCGRLKQIRIPATVISVGESAFQMSGLTGIELPDSVTEIGSGAFEYCDLLQEMVVPGSVKRIETFTFQNCSRMRRIVLPEGLQSVGGWAFDNCYGLEEIVLPDGVREIGSGAFHGCSGLTEMILPDSILRIGSEAFVNCSGLTTLRLPCRLSEIEDFTFESCCNLTEISLPAGLTRIGKYAFRLCGGLKQIDIPDSVTDIGFCAFSECRSLRSFSYPRGRTSIDTQDLYACSGLEKLYIPSSVTEIAVYQYWPSSVVIYGESGSYAEAWASEKGYAFRDVNDVLRLSFDALTLGAGERRSLSPSIVGTSFTCSKSGIVSVSADGTVKGLKAGTTVITATAQGYDPVLCTVTVRKAPSKLVLSAKKMTVRVDQTGEQARQIRAKLSPSGCHQEVEWKSTDLAVATVDENGVVTPVSPGTTIIKARTYNGKSARCKVTVLPLPDSVVFNKTELNLNEKQTAALKVILTPANAAAENTFVSSDPGVASVSRTGKITAHKAGTAAITVTTCNGLSAECRVTVWKAPRSVRLDHVKATMAVGQTISLMYSVSPVDANPAVKWSSSASRIASVDRNGVVTGRQAGKATIAVKTANGKTKTCKVTVKLAPTTLRLAAAKSVIGVGEVTKVKAVLPKKTYSPIGWSVTGPAVIDEKGNVTGLDTGTACITAETVNGLTASIEIAVLPAAGDFTLSADSLTIKKGKSAVLKVILPEGTAAGYAFRSSAPKIAAVNNAGKISGKKKGTAVITVTLMNGKEKTCEVTVR